MLFNLPAEDKRKNLPLRSVTIFFRTLNNIELVARKVVRFRTKKRWTADQMGSRSNPIRLTRLSWVNSDTNKQKVILILERKIKKESRL